MRFGKLRIIGIFRNNKNILKALCICDCGNFRMVYKYGLTSGNTKSCGCLLRTHGLRHTTFYGSWRAMKERCYNNNNIAYGRYGARGIKVCIRWRKFENFRDDMYEDYLEHVSKYGEKETTIDRIDNDGIYTPDNCRWATRKEQAKNSPRLREFEAISPEGEFFVANNQARFAKEYGLDKTSVNYCLSGRVLGYKGWKFEYVRGGYE